MMVMTAEEEGGGGKEPNKTTANGEELLQYPAFLIKGVKIF
jgi:hypothetical protein